MRLMIGRTLRTEASYSLWAFVQIGVAWLGGLASLYKKHLARFQA